MVLFSTWPIVNIPVTFGGGITIEYDFFEDVSSPWK
jgi:hypothetical protein